MTKPTQKTLILLVAVALLGAAGGAGATYLSLRKQYSSDAAIRTAGPESSDFANSSPAVSQDNTLPEGVLSPQAVALEPHKYADKQIKVKGNVVESQPGQYSLVGQEAGKPLGLRLDFSKSNTDPKSFSPASAGAQTENEKPAVPAPVTVSGTLVSTKANDSNTYTYSLVVESVQ